jgi:predicted dehydrogenase
MTFALVGTGRWGRVYVKTLSEIQDAQLVATCSRTSKADFNVPHYNNVDELLDNTNADTIIIASHPDSHYDIACKALWRDKKVICEKPCLFTEAQYTQIERLASASIFFTDYTNVFHKVIDCIKEVISQSPPRYQMRLLNVGNGPIRDYSDAYDYGSHVASVIYHVFPDEVFKNIQFGYTLEGNHTLKMVGAHVDVEATFGNKSQHRLHRFEFSSQKTFACWFNDKSENPLKVMLQKFIKGQLRTNLDLSRKVSALLSKCE